MKTAHRKAAKAMREMEAALQRALNESEPVDGLAEEPEPFVIPIYEQSR